MSPFLLFNFEITSHCNAKCPSCFRTSLLDYNKNWSNNENYLSNFKHLSVNDFENFILENISFLKKNDYGHTIAKFCGEVGDPLMHPEIEVLINLSSMVFDKIEIFTNGGLRYKKWIKKLLMKYSKLHFVFGIDGITDEINQKYRIGVRTDLALSNMIESAKHRFTKWEYTIFEHNHHQLQDAIDFAKDHSIYILARVNGRPYSKLNEDNVKKVESILNKNETNFYLCKITK